MTKLLITLFAFILTALTPAYSAVAQEQTRELGEEAYGVLRSSFLYDAGYPLNARSSGTRSSGELEFEKIAFTSFHDGVVP